MVCFKLCTDIFPCFSSHKRDLVVNRDLCSTVVSLGNTSFLKSPGLSVMELCNCYSGCWYLYNSTEKGTLTFSYQLQVKFVVQQINVLPQCFVSPEIFRLGEIKCTGVSWCINCFWWRWWGLEGQQSCSAPLISCVLCIQIGLRNTQTVLFNLSWR